MWNDQQRNDKSTLSQKCKQSVLEPDFHTETFQNLSEIESVEYGIEQMIKQFENDEQDESKKLISSTKCDQSDLDLDSCCGIFHNFSNIESSKCSKEVDGKEKANNELWREDELQNDKSTPSAKYKQPDSEFDSQSDSPQTAPKINTEKDTSKRGDCEEKTLRQMWNNQQ
eukprot:15325729-Ditylum_brightwellii.AAC.1